MFSHKIYEASPSIQEFVAIKRCEWSRKHITRLLEKRFGIVPDDLAVHLRAIENQDKLEHLHDVAIECPNLDAFRAAMVESA